MPKQLKISPAYDSSSESSSESSSKTLCASAPNCAPCVSTAVNKDEKDVSGSPSEEDNTLTDKTLIP